jgi:hypothetical protein
VRPPARRRYAAILLERYRRLPGTLGRVLKDDRKTALDLHIRGVSLDLVQRAFLLAVARRSFRAHAEPGEPIRCLRYFLPVIEELVVAPPDPDYFRYLAHKLRSVGIEPPA